MGGVGVYWGWGWTMSGVGLKGGSFHQVVRLVKWALQALLIVLPWEWWGATEGLQAWSHMSRKGTLIILQAMRKEGLQVLIQSSQ